MLYFFPAASASTIEAHAFAEGQMILKKLGATVIGVTAGNTDQVDEFSKLECRDKFTVTADPVRESRRAVRHADANERQNPFRPYLFRHRAGR